MMQALMKIASGVGNVELRTIDEPVPGDGQVLIAVSATGICGTDLHIYRDEFRTRPPVVMGHEIAGSIAAVGAGVTCATVGQRVTTETYFSTCGSCRSCRAGRANLCLERRSIGSAVNGGFARYVVVPERNIHLLPDGVDDIGGALTEPLACVVHGALEQAHVTPGDVAVIAGPGTIGLLTLQVLKAAGAQVVVLGTEQDEQRLALARSLGADDTINVQAQDAERVIRELTDGDGADIVYECSGAGPAAQQLLTLVRRGGQYVQIGLLGRSVAWDLDQVCYKELRVSGSNASVPSAWQRALTLLRSGQVHTSSLVTDVVPLVEWERAFSAFERKQGVKFVLVPE